MEIVQMALCTKQEVQIWECFRTIKILVVILHVLLKTFDQGELIEPDIVGLVAKDKRIRHYRVLIQ